MKLTSEEQMHKRVAEIDAMFETATGSTGWGSWMVECANERERLIDKLNADFGHNFEHKWLARSGSGGRVS